MATIKRLMPYLERGYMAADLFRIGPAYLRPVRQDGALLFKWLAYGMEGEWSGPETYTQEQVSTWKSDDWGILCHTDGRAGGGLEYCEEEAADIEQAIAGGFAYKVEGFE